MGCQVNIYIDKTWRIEANTFMVLQRWKKCHKCSRKKHKNNPIERKMWFFCGSMMRLTFCGLITESKQNGEQFFLPF